MISSRVSLTFLSLTFLRASVSLCLVLAAGCGGGGVSGDQASKFAGAWTFESGMLTPMCGNLAVPAFKLTGLPLVLTKVDDTTIKVVEENNTMKVMKKAATVADVAAAFAALGAKPRDLVSILRALKAAGALRADLETM